MSELYKPSTILPIIHIELPMPFLLIMKISRELVSRDGYYLHATYDFVDQYEVTWQYEPSGAALASV